MMKSALPLKIAASLVRAWTTTPGSADAAIVLLVTPSCSWLGRPSVLPNRTSVTADHHVSQPLSHVTARTDDRSMRARIASG